jgi:hypothetical protein
MQEFDAESDDAQSGDSALSTFDFKQRDIVFAEITSRLHFNDLKRHLAGAGEAMTAARAKYRSIRFPRAVTLCRRWSFPRLRHDPMLCDARAGARKE